MKPAMEILYAYIEARANPGGSSSIGSMGRGGSGEPSRDPSGVLLHAATVGISISRCPVRYHGANVLETWVRVVENHTIPVWESDRIERTREFNEACRWLEKDMARRMKAERERRNG